MANGRPDGVTRTRDKIIKVSICGAVIGAALGLGLATLAGPSPANGEAGVAAPGPGMSGVQRAAIDATHFRPPSAVSDPKLGDHAGGPAPKIVLAAARSPAPIAPIDLVDPIDEEAPAEIQLAAIDFYPRPAESAVAAPAVPSPAAKPTMDKTIAVGKGDTLMKVLVRAGADRRQAHGAIVALAKVFDPRRLKVGQKVTLTFQARDGEDGGPELVSVALDAAIDREVVAIRDGGGDFVPRELTKQFDTRLTRGDGKIKYSLYVAATRAGLPVSVIVEMIRILSWDVDFQRDIQPGDAFEVVYERDFDEHGQAVREGAIRFVSLSLGGVELAYYRYQPSDDDLVDYFDAEGRSVRKALLRTPVDGAKLTSGYGKRRHPILGYNRVHRGVDFGAPKGTPIYAAGDGMVEMAKWEGNFGRYVRIRHNNDIKTAYAHMSRIAKGARKGKRVRQGQVIGYVGSTGMSTGPHLHYEVIVKGHKKNPMRVKLPTGRQLKGKELKRFDKSRKALAAKIAKLRATGPVLADNVD